MQTANSKLVLYVQGKGHTEKDEMLDITGEAESAIRHGAPAEKVRGMSRHASLDTLMIYYHEADRIDDPAERYISYDSAT